MVAVTLRVVAIVMETESVYCRQNKGKQDQKEAAAAKTKKTQEEELEHESIRQEDVRSSS